MQPFDSYTCSLSGNHIVEAGAGTGKTYNIQILVARMVLAGTPIDRILVVTFTRNATAELRERIRGVLIEVIDALRVGKLDADSRAARLVKDMDASQALELLTIALRDIDSAAIYTIDAFCIRMLNENAFESNRRYNIAICPDVSALIRTAVNDFVRRVFFVRGDSAEDAFFFRQFAYGYCNIKADSLFDACKAALNDTYAICDFGNDGDDNVTLEEDCTNAAQACYQEFIKKCINAAIIFKCGSLEVPSNEHRELWCSQVAALQEYLSEALGIVMNSTGGMQTQPWRVKRKIDESWLQFSLGGEKWFASGTKCNPPKDVVEKLLCNDALNKFKRVVTAQAVREVCNAVQKLKDANGVITYSDSLTQMQHALDTPDSPLCEVVRKRYNCAIVDEFQDTNAGQYAVFKRIFGDSPVHSFFMIGDPKQAIYSFRGGDIYSYSTARDDVADANEEHLHTLTQNFRSSTAYIAAMNQFFGSTGVDFFNTKNSDEAANAMPAIDFEQIQPSGKEDTLKIELPGGDEWPLLSSGGDAITNDDLAIEATVTEICQLLAQRSHIFVAGTPLTAGHIAVLVRNNKTGSKLEQELLKRGVNCCLHGASGLFERPEAKQLLTILDAIDESNRRERVMALLALPLFNFDMDTLKRFHDEDAGAVQSILTDLRQQWEETTFLQMYNRFMRLSLRDLLGESADEQTAERTIAQLMVGHPSENDLAIWKQLGEALHYIAITERYGIAEIIAWLRDAIHGYENKNDENAGEDELEDKLMRIRIRTQDDAVTIMTIHKSKGLQFPIVFLPRIGKYCGGNVPKNKRYHDGKGRRKLVIDTAADAVQECCDREAQAERRRLLYVAITRARYMFRLIGGLENLFDEEEIQPQLPSKAVLVWGCEMPPVTGDASAEKTQPAVTPYERFDAHCPRGWQTCSYTSLSKARKLANASDSAAVPDATHAAMQSDDDTPPPVVPSDAGYSDESGVSSVDAVQEERSAIFRFSRGAAAGKVWHKLFEELDYQQEDDEELRNWLRDELTRYHQLPKDDDALCSAMLDAAFAVVRGVMDNPLPGTSICLRDVSPSQRRHELNFKFSLGGGDGIDCTAVRKLLAEYAIAMPDGWFAANASATPDNAEESVTYRDFTLVGAIDLIFRAQDKFWIVDWKTNALCKYGETPSLERFDPGSPDCMLAAEMDDHFYTLQYLIYTVAFMQWYASVNRGFVWDEDAYERLFGGCCYVFLRGVAPTHPGRGYFTARPQWPLIEQLYRILGRRTR